jgi:hypothetical protein
MRCLALRTVVLVALVVSHGDGLFAEGAEEWFGERVNAELSLHVLSDAEISKDVGISKEQQIALEQLNQELQDQSRKAIRESLQLPMSSEMRKRGLEAMTAIDMEFRPLVWELLTVPQRSRLRQVFLQFDVASALLHDPLVVKELGMNKAQEADIIKISEAFTEQRREILRSRAPREERSVRLREAMVKRDAQTFGVLDDGQRSKWSELIGEPIDVAALRTRLESRRSASPPK